MLTLDARNETYGLDIKVAASLANRHEVMTADTLAAGGTGVSVQELINALCDLTDGCDVHDIVGNTGLPIEFADRIMEIRKAVAPLWTYNDGRKVIG
jgi:hypothetical protein